MISVTHSPYESSSMATGYSINAGSEGEFSIVTSNPMRDSFAYIQSIARAAQEVQRSLNAHLPIAVIEIVESDHLNHNRLFVEIVRVHGVNDIMLQDAARRCFARTLAHWKQLAAGNQVTDARAIAEAMGNMKIAVQSDDHAEADAVDIPTQNGKALLRDCLYHAWVNEGYACCEGFSFGQEVTV